MAGSTFRITFEAITAPLVSGFRTASRESEKLSGSLHKTKRASLDVREGALRVEAAQGRAARAAKRYGADSLQAAQAQLRLERAQERLAASTEASSSRMAAFGGRVGSTVKSMAGFAATSAGIVGVGAAVHGVVKSFGDFDSGLREVGAVSGLSGAKLDGLGKIARKAGLDTGVGANEATQAMVELAKAGLSASQIGPALKGTLALAQAGGMEAGEAASSAANAIQTFGLGAKDATKVADEFANAANATTANVSDFALALSQGGSAAKLAGVSFSDTVLTLTDLAKMGIKGSDAGTSMKTAFLQLAKPTAQAQAAMDKFGLSFFTASGNMKSVSDISQMLQDKLGGLSKQQQVATLQTIAGTDGFRTLAAMMRLSGTQSEALSKFLGETGSAARKARKMQAGWQGDLNRLRAEFQDLGISIGQVLVPYVGQGAQALTHFIDQVRDGTGTGGRFADAVKQMWQQAKPVAEWFGHAAVDVGKFTAHHPDLLKAAAAIVGVGLAIKGIKFVSRASGISDLISLLLRLRRIAPGAGAGAGEDAAAGLAGGFARKGRGLRAGIRQTIKDLIVPGGTAAGSGAASTAASGMAETLPGAMKRAGVRAILRNSLKLAVAGAGASMAAVIVSEFGDYLDKHLFHGGAHTNAKVRKETGDIGIPGANASDGANVFDLIGSIFHRNGGVAGFAAGGMVPAAVSPGEAIFYGNSSWTVPGPRTAADSVATMLPVGAMVFTDHGQQMLSQGASFAEALAFQRPHFAAGGVVRGRVSTFGPPGEGAGTTASGLSSSAPGLALNIAPGTDSGWNNPTTDRWVSTRQLMDVVIGRHRGVLPVIDKGPAGFTHRAIDVTGAGAKALGIDPKHFPTDSIGTARPARGSARVSAAGRGIAYTQITPAAISHSFTPNLQTPSVADAFDQAYQAALSGAAVFHDARGADTDLFRQLVAGVSPTDKDLPTRKRVSVAGLAGSVAGGGGTGATAWRGKTPTGLHSGVKQLASLVMGRYKDLSVTSTTGGGHAKNSYHYLGEAVDIGGPAKSMLNAAGWIRTQYASQLAEGIHNPNLSVKDGKVYGGAGPFGAVWGAHANHIHLAVTAAKIRQAAARKPRMSAGSSVTPPWAQMGPPTPIGKSWPFVGARGGRVQAFARGGVVNPAVLSGRARAAASVSADATRLAGMIDAIVSAPINAVAETVARMRSLTQTAAEAARHVGSHIAATEADIRSQIAGLNKDGATGTERVQIRRLRATLGILDAAVGARVGKLSASAQQIAKGAGEWQTRVDLTKRRKGIPDDSPLGINLSLAAIKATYTRLGGSVSETRKAIAAARKQGHKPPQELIDQLADYRGQRRELVASYAEQRRALPAAITAQRLQGFDRSAALAALTPGKGDDRASLAGRIGALADELSKAQRRGDTSATIDLAQQLKSTQDTLKDLDRSMQIEPSQTKLALAGLTEGLGDDLAALTEQQGVYTRQLADAIHSGDADAIQQAASGLAGVNQQIKTDRQTAALKPNDLATAMAGLTDSLDDDLAAATDRRGILKGLLKQAQDSGDVDAQIDLAGQLASTQSSIDSLTDQITQSNELAQQKLDLDTELRDNQRRLLAIAEGDSSRMMAALIAAVSGDIGGRASLGMQTPGFAGQGARY